MRAVGYARVSTDEQAEHGSGLQEQIARIAAYCAAHGHELIETVTDDFTGKMITRPGLSRVSALAESRSFDVLVCLRLDRLARLNHLRRTYEDRLRDQGVHVVYVEQSFEATPSGQLQRGIMGELAEYESELIRERTSSGRTRKALDSGRIPVSCNTFGYRQISVAQSLALPEYAGRSGELIIVEEQAAIIRRMFTLYAQGMTLRQLSRQLALEGLKSSAGGLWEFVVIRRTLRNETYAGRLYYNKDKCARNGRITPGGGISVSTTRRPKSEWILLPCPAIIEESLFQTVQARLDFNRERMSGRSSTEWLLHGVISCQQCKTSSGAPVACSGSITRDKKRGYAHRYYRCTSPLRAGMVSCRTYYPADKVEGMALDALRRVATPGTLAAIARKRTVSLKGVNHKSEAGKLEKQLLSLDEEESRIADLVLTGFSDALIATKVAAIAARRRTLLQELAIARNYASATDPENAARLGERAADWLRQRLNTAGDNRELLSELCRLFLDVRIYRGRDPEITVKVPELG